MILQLLICHIYMYLTLKMNMTPLEFHQEVWCDFDVRKLETSDRLSNAKII